MSEVFYADVKFKKQQKTDKKDDGSNDVTYSEINIHRADQNQISNAGNPDCQPQVGSKVTSGGDVKFKKQPKTDKKDDGSNDVTYSEINIHRADQDQISNAGNPDCQPQVGSKVTSGGCDPIRVALVLLCVLLTGAVVIIVVIYLPKMDATTKNKELQDLLAECQHLFQKEKDMRKRDETVCETCLKCAPGFEFFEGKFYYISSDKLPWNESRDKCTSIGGDLVIIESEKEQGFLAKKLSVIKREEEDDKFWIGLTDVKQEGTWLWVDGSPLNKDNSFWLENQPEDWKGINNEHPNGEDCVRMGERSNVPKIWVDAHCSRPQMRICEMNSP